MTSALSTWLGAASSPALTIRPDFDAVDAMTPDRDVLWQRLDRTTFLTPNEKRAAAGYGPLSDGADTLKFSPSTRHSPMRTPLRARFAVPIDTKTLADDGTFEGYASLFDRPDLGQDVIAPGAFSDTLKRRGAGGVKLLWQHDPASPIGVWDEIREDRKGLYVRGRLLLDVARAKEALALIRDGAIDGLSIGFKLQSGKRDARTGLRRITKLDLWEISVVTFPMLPDARVSALKRMTPLTSASALEFERWLMTEGKLTKREAQAFLTRGLRGLHALATATRTDSLASQLRAATRALRT